MIHRDVNLYRADAVHDARPQVIMGRDTRRSLSIKCGEALNGQNVGNPPDRRHA